MLLEEIIGHLQSATKELVDKPCHIFFSKLCTEGKLHNGGSLYVLKIP
jgi:hypothetical protein